MAGRDVPATAQALQAAGVPAHLAQDCQDLADDAHLKARNYYTYVPHSAKGKQLVTGLAGRFSSTETGVSRSGGLVGSDNRYVFIDLLGLNDAEFQAAVTSGAIEEPSRTGEERGT
jgi:crotonobetainyl-CoA:carnitine CoA-transferase CaiB-like acyl-CoA transferase